MHPVKIDARMMVAKSVFLQSVCVRLGWVARSSQNLGGSSVLVACVVGFHEGTDSVSSKVK